MSTHELFSYLRVKHAGKAIEFYRDVFGAKEKYRLTEPSGRIGHAELDFDGASLMLSDEYPEYGITGPQTLGGVSSSIHLHVDDCDAVIRRAVAAGATLVREAKDQFYGERSGTVRDPFGHEWNIGHHLEDLTPAEMQKRYDAMMASAPPAALAVESIATKPPPAGWPRLSSSPSYLEAGVAIDWLVRAFGFVVDLRIEGEGGRIEHSQLTLGGGLIMLGDIKPERGQGWRKSPRQVDGNTQSMMLFVDDADAHCARARAAGAKIAAEPSTRDHGEGYWVDRSYEAIDLEGHHWYFVQRISTSDKPRP
jgi:uncharacterized glyoxalase superfamily protein PhnB